MPTMAEQRAPQADAEWRAAAMAAAVDARAVVLVEGISDRVALEALAERRGRDLDAEGVSIVPIGGAQAIRRFLALFGPDGADITVAGLCDVGAEDDYRRGLERTGLGSNLSRSEMEALGFGVCVVDLEDELIRALGTSSVVDVIDAHGDTERSARSRSRRRGEDGRSRSSSAASWGAADAARSGMRVTSSRRSI